MRGVAFAFAFLGAPLLITVAHVSPCIGRLPLGSIRREATAPLAFFLFFFYFFFFLRTLPVPSPIELATGAGLLAPPDPVVSAGKRPLRRNGDHSSSFPNNLKLQN